MKPKPHPVQTLGVYGAADGGGCFDLATIKLMPGVGLYHESHLTEMVIHERVMFIPYILSVLAVLGTQPELQP